MNRKIFYWKLRTLELPLGDRTLIMGILNVTPDSFSDGGLYSDPDRAYARALELEQEGADIIDIGAESTRPGSMRISADQEWQRLVPVLKRLSGKLNVPLSIDTYKSEIAERAFDYGVEIVNDPSGLTFDATLAKTAASANAGLILNHMRGTPESWAKLPPLPDAPAAIARDLEATISRARRAGVEQNRIVIDPGIGFGKRGEQNAEILAHLGELARLDLPLMIGPSRKIFLRQKTEEETVFATAAAVTAGILRGAHIVRVHDVKQMRAAVAVADEIARAAAIQRVQIERPATRPKARAAGREHGAFVEPEQARPTRPPIVPSPVRDAEVIRAAPPNSEQREAAAERRAPERPEKDFSRNRPFRQRGPGGDRRRDESGPRGDRRNAGPRDRPPRDSRSGERPPRGRFGGPPSRGEANRGDQRRGPRSQDRDNRGAGPPRERATPRGEQPRGGNQGQRSGPPPKRPFRKRP